MLAPFIDRPREDSLTASVISHLLHLPFEVCWRILRNACYQSEMLPQNPGEPEVHAWPHWSPTGTRNSRFVEPDVFLRFPDFDLIVEAKFEDWGQQNPEQWARELEAYGNEYGEERRFVKMLAIGGIHQTHDALIKHRWIPPCNGGDKEEAPHDFDCPVHMCQWSRVLHQCRQLEREITKAAYPTSQSLAHRRILADLIRMFAHHGYQTGIWYSETIGHRVRLGGNFETSCITFRTIHNQFNPLSA